MTYERGTLSWHGCTEKFSRPFAGSCARMAHSTMLRAEMKSMKRLSHPTAACWVVKELTLQ